MKIVEQHACGMHRRLHAIAMSLTAETEKEFALIVLTEDGTIVDAHDSCVDSLGWTREELAGRDVGDLIPAHRGLLIARILQSADLHSQVGDDATFAMHISVHRVDESSLPAKLVVRRFPGTECWTAAFYEAAPLCPPPPPAAKEAVSVAGDAGMPGELPELEALSETQTGEPQVNELPNDELCESHGDAHAMALFSETSESGVQEVECDEPLSEDLSVSAEEETATFDPSDFAPTLSPHSESPASTGIHATSSEHAEDSAPNAPPSTSTRGVDLENERAERRLLEDRVASLAAQIASLHLQLGQHLEEQARAHKKLNALEDQLAQGKAPHAKQKPDTLKELEGLRKRNKALDEQMAACQSANEALQRTQAETESQLTASTAELKQAREALAQESKNRQDLERKLAAEMERHAGQQRQSRLEISKLEARLKAQEAEIKRLSGAA